MKLNSTEIFVLTCLVVVTSKEAITGFVTGQYFVIITFSMTFDQNCRYSCICACTCWALICSLVFKGWFATTELYYGAYTNETIEKINGFEYNLPLAYLCVGGGYLLLCLIMLVYRYYCWQQLFIIRFWLYSFWNTFL